MSDFPGRPTAESPGACLSNPRGPDAAPEDDGPTMDALRFSLASDIVELVVLTEDGIFLQTLREAVGDTRRLWHVPASDKVSDLMFAGGALHHRDQASISRSGRGGRGYSRVRNLVGAPGQRRHRVPVHP